jgi:formylglycine-generating enzyme required for sulfatase activity
MVIVKSSEITDKCKGNWCQFEGRAPSLTSLLTSADQVGRGSALMGYDLNERVNLLRAHIGMLWRVAKLALVAVVAFSATCALTRAFREAETPHPAQPGDSALAPSSVDRTTNPRVQLQAKKGARTANPAGMVWVPGGEFLMGTDDPQANPVEHPAHQVRIGGFWMDQTEVTNSQFGHFVQATGYATTAERSIEWEQLKTQLPPGTPRVPDSQLVPGSLVFTPPDHPVPLNDIRHWWKWIPGASWRHPEGPGSSIVGKDSFPVVHVSWDDASAYAKWAGKELPTEAQWEFASRGGREVAKYPWGDELRLTGRFQANTWQGHFPETNSAEDGFPRLAPVCSFPPNGYGLYDMIGNVWEWCADWYRPDTYRARASSMPVVDPEGPESSYDPEDPYPPKRVTRGGSFLCSANYCTNYRLTARRGTATDSGMSHLGFRCVLVPALEMEKRASDPAQR